MPRLSSISLAALSLSITDWFKGAWSKCQQLCDSLQLHPDEVPEMLAALTSTASLSELLKVSGFLGTESRQHGVAVVACCSGNRYGRRSGFAAPVL